MTETALSEQAMRKSLLDIRIPQEVALEVYADLFLAVGLGGCLALICIGLARLVMRRRTVPVEPDIRQRVTYLRSLPAEARRIGFSTLLKEIAPERYAAIRNDLYRPDGAVDPEREVLRRV